MSVDLLKQGYATTNHERHADIEARGNIAILFPAGKKRNLAVGVLAAEEGT